MESCAWERISVVQNNADEEKFVNPSTIEKALTKVHAEAPPDTLDSNHEYQPIMEALCTSVHNHWTMDNTPDTLQDLLNGPISNCTDFLVVVLKIHVF